MDTTGSMYGEISNLQSALTGTVIPGIQSAVANSQFGVGALEDFPVSTYGNLHGSDCGRGGDSTPDQPFKLRQAITSNVTAPYRQRSNSALQRHLARRSAAVNDAPEGGLEAIYQAATGEGLSAPSPTSVPANHTGIGGVAFRPGTMPVIVDVGDAIRHGVGETAQCTSTRRISRIHRRQSRPYAHSRAQTEDRAREHLRARRRHRGASRPR